MATITFSLNSTPLTGSKAFTGTDADMQNLLNWAAVEHAALIFQMFSTRTPTNAQIAAALAQDTINKWKNQVQNYMTSLAIPPPMTWS